MCVCVCFWESREAHLFSFANVQVADEDAKRAAADRDLAVKKAAYKTEINDAEATAEVAFEIQKAKQGQAVRTSVSK